MNNELEDINNNIYIKCRKIFIYILTLLVISVILIPFILQLYKHYYMVSFLLLYLIYIFICEFCLVYIFMEYVDIKELRSKRNTVTPINNYQESSEVVV